MKDLVNNKIGKSSFIKLQPRVSKQYLLMATKVKGGNYGDS